MRQIQFMDDDDLVRRRSRGSSLSLFSSFTLICLIFHFSFWGLGLFRFFCRLPLQNKL
ncbi:hypothetical protein LINGRAHAP2_LOCUS2930, partial [Linum grandiflorum]